MLAPFRDGHVLYTTLRYLSPPTNAPTPSPSHEKAARFFEPQAKAGAQQTPVLPTDKSRGTTYCMYEHDAIEHHEKVHMDETETPERVVLVE